jgi:hypothetical protein
MIASAKNYPVRISVCAAKIGKKEKEASCCQIVNLAAIIKNSVH